MHRGPLSQLLAHLQRTLGPADSDDSDARLLERFIGRGDEQAFASLLRRHASMVYGVCNRVLGNAADAEDVFQATFLVLVRKARSVRTLPSVGSWLYGVAYRTALEARRAMARRRAKEAEAPPRPKAPDEMILDELREVLDVELARLPERYRQVLVLCDLEGQRRKEVAQQLRCPEGTVASRLAKARSLLAGRLARHGLTFSAGTLATALAAEAASASVPAAWLPATSQVLANAVNSGGAVSAKVLHLVQGACRTMLVKKLTNIGAIVLLVAATGLGAGTLYFQTAMAGPPDDGQKRNAAAQAKPEEVRQEVQRLKVEVRSLQTKIAELETRLAELQRAQARPLFRGKPAAYWLTALQDRDPKFRQEALTALGAIAEVDHSLLPTIVAALRDGDRDVRRTAADLVAELHAEALPLLIAALKDSKQDKRGWILYSISLIGKEAAPAVPAVTALLRSSDKADRILAARTLGSIGPPAAPAVPALIRFLKDPATRECDVAATALGRIGPSAREAVPLLADILNNTNGHSFPYDPSLAPFFEAPNGRVQPTTIPAVTAAVALGKIGPAAKSALPGLRALALKLQGPRGPFGLLQRQRTVFEAIKKIDPMADVSEKSGLGR